MAGRFAHGDGWGGPGAHLGLAREALEQVGLGHLGTQDVLRLSGGERQRVALATLLVQSPALYLLDEPTSHQDIAAQLQVMQLLQGLAQQGKAVVASCHDINLARRFASHILLLDGTSANAGNVETVMQPALLAAAFGCRFEQIAASTGWSSWRGRARRNAAAFVIYFMFSLGDMLYLYKMPENSTSISLLIFTYSHLPI
jgi:iron complex transport system ATP-binding protein